MGVFIIVVGLSVIIAIAVWATYEYDETAHTGQSPNFHEPVVTKQSTLCQGHCCRIHTQSDDDFATSMLIGTATDSALLGGMVGGSLVGGMVGAAIADSLQQQQQQQQDSSFVDNSSDSDISDDSSSSSSDSSYDSSDSSSSSDNSGSGGDY